MKEGEHYLGDGVFVSFDGWLFTLRAPRPDGNHYVHLEPDTFEGLQRYVTRILARSEPEAPPCET